MKKLKLNKESISNLSQVEMKSVNGGISLHSCDRGSDRGKKCCEGGGIAITFTTVKK